ncbi:CoA transferase [Alphaproteobacteria bacterium]|nr:CoA transferase [Alphaproteobacteria bacterium]
MESAAAFQSIRLMSGYMEGPYKHASSPSGTFKTKDGWIQLIVVKNHEFNKFCDAVGWNKFKDDLRFFSNTKRREHENFLTKEVQKLFVNKPTDYWKNLLDQYQVQNEKVQSYKELVESNQSRELNLISWLDQPTTGRLWPIPNIPGLSKLIENDSNSSAPSLGQHSKEILLSQGYTNEEILNLKIQKIIA